MNRGTLQWSSLFCECSERLCILRLSWAGCVKLSFFPCLPSFCGFHLLTTTWFSIVVSISLPRYLPDRIHWNTFLWWWYAQIWYKFSSASCVKSAISQWYTVNFYECAHFCWMNGKTKKKKRNHILISETSKSHWFQKFCFWLSVKLEPFAETGRLAKCTGTYLSYLTFLLHLVLQSDCPITGQSCTCVHGFESVSQLISTAQFSMNWVSAWLQAASKQT